MGTNYFIDKPNVRSHMNEYQAYCTKAQQVKNTSVLHVNRYDTQYIYVLARGVYS